MPFPAWTKPADQAAPDAQKCRAKDLFPIDENKNRPQTFRLAVASASQPLGDVT